MNIRARFHLHWHLSVPRHRSVCRRRSSSGIDSLQRRKGRSDLEDASVVIHDGSHGQKAGDLDLSLTAIPHCNRSGGVFDGANERPSHLMLRVDELTVLAPEKRKVRRRDDVEEGQLIKLLHRFELEELHKESIALEQLSRVDLDDEARHAVIHPDALIIDPISTHAATHLLHCALVHLRAVAGEVARAGSVALCVHRVHNARLVGRIDGDPGGAERGVTNLALEEVVVVFVRENLVFAANSVGQKITNIWR